MFLQTRCSCLYAWIVHIQCRGFIDLVQGYRRLQAGYLTGHEREIPIGELIIQQSQYRQKPILRQAFWVAAFEQAYRTLETLGYLGLHGYCPRNGTGSCRMTTQLTPCAAAPVRTWHRSSSSEYP